jgi:hypothetical protein
MFSAESYRLQPVTCFAPVITGLLARRGLVDDVVAVLAGVLRAEPEGAREAVGAAEQVDVDVRGHLRIQGPDLGLSLGERAGRGEGAAGAAAGG